MYQQLEDFPRWEISPAGDIRNVETKEPKYCEFHNGGYLRTEFIKGPKRIRKRVHRLVAQAFIPNPGGLETVNHKNGIKDDNRVENLEWMSVGANTRHAWDTGLCVPYTVRCLYATQLQRLDGFGLVCFGHKDFPPPLSAAEVSNCINRPHKHLSARGWKVTKLELPAPIHWA